MSKSYHGYKTYYRDVSGQLDVVAATDDTTLVTARSANHTIFIQVIHVEFTNNNAATWNFEDSTGTPVEIAYTGAVTDGSHITYDFGPRGLALTEGKNFVLNVSATGGTGRITWEGYTRITAAMAAGPTN